MTTQTFIPYAKQSISSQDCEEVSKALMGEWITRGPLVELFEKEIAAYCGAQYAVAFNSGSAALAAAYFAAKVTPGDRIISTPNTFVSTVGTALQFGGTAVFVDIDKATGAADIENLVFNANLPSSRGKSIIVPVHFAGMPVNMETLDSFIANPDTIVIEDAAHAIGTSYSLNGPKVGSCAWSHMTMFSFHPAKLITTGEGGLITTNSEELCRRLKLYRNNGIERDPKYLQSPSTPWYYEVQALTNNYNFTDFQAALGLSQLKRLDQFISKRRELIKAYRKEIADTEYLRLLTSEFDEHTAFHLCVAQIDFAALGKDRANLMEYLRHNGIGTQVHYIPLYKHPVFIKECGTISDYFPQTEAYYEQALSLPLFYDMTSDDVNRIITTIKSFFK